MYAIRSYYEELIVSKDIDKWAEELAQKSFVNKTELGKSKLGRSIGILQIGNNESDKLVMVLSRQHPPEVTGWLAMKAFVERVRITSYNVCYTKLLRAKIF